MAHPKTRISKQRKRKRRTHYKIEAPNVVACSNCGSPKLTHHICGECGFYRGRPIIAVASKNEVTTDTTDED
jgi:large subunit ribosomal protein L32